jgi:hypothetical protein
LRQQVHNAVIRSLKPGGTLLLEAFTLNQLPRTSGGPKTAELLFTRELIVSDFKELIFTEFAETQTTLNEGPLHQGLADVIQLTALKPI